MLNIPVNMFVTWVSSPPVLRIATRVVPTKEENLTGFLTPSQVLMSISISMIASVHPNRLPSIYSPPEKTDLLLQQAHAQFFSPQKPRYINWASSGPLQSESRQIIAEPKDDDRTVAVDINQSLDPIAVYYDEYISPAPKETVDKRMASSYQEPFTARDNPNNRHYHHQASAESGHTFDICLGSYAIKDLGHHFYPRFIETTNCPDPESSHHRIKCEHIKYHVQVLTQRKDTDPEDSTHRSALPESLRDWRFVHIAVNVGCHCTIQGNAQQ